MIKCKCLPENHGNCNGEISECLVNSATNGYCFSRKAKNKSNQVQLSLGCYIDFAGIKHPRCPFTSDKLVTRCCNEYDYCNEEIDINEYPFVELTTTRPPPTTGNTTTTPITDISNKPYFVSVIVIPIAGLFLFIFLGLLCCRLFGKPVRFPAGTAIKRWRARPSLRRSDLLLAAAAEDTASTRAGTDLAHSSSGSGFPLLLQRTIARQIRLGDPIGRGRYGEVWCGSWRAENDVAVKIFSSRDEASFRREVEIYGTTTIRHPNILGFIAADFKDTGIKTELWLITEYHVNGSLYGYLQTHSLSLLVSLSMAASIARGLAHLHSDIPECKPGIAHRDLKSTNVLVKDSGRECCIADLGLAVVHELSTHTVVIPDNDNRAGTRRYMAPEVLDRVPMRGIDSYRRADVYALGLVVWEIAKRTRAVSGPFSECIQPYQDLVGMSEPSYEQLRRVVCVEGRRPTMSTHWETDDILRRLAELMRDCWSANPAVRITALRCQKSLTAILADIPRELATLTEGFTSVEVETFA